MKYGGTLIFLLFAYQCGNRWAWYNAALWTVYLVWEIAAQYWTPEANIRVDLLFLWQVLAISSALALWKCAKK